MLTGTFQFQNIKSSNPKLATTEIAKKLGERWQKMSGNIPAVAHTLVIMCLLRDTTRAVVDIIC